MIHLSISQQARRFDYHYVVNIYTDKTDLTIVFNISYDTILDNIAIYNHSSPNISKYRKQRADLIYHSE